MALTTVYITAKKESRGVKEKIAPYLRRRNEMKLSGIYMQNDVWLSRQTIKSILSEDLGNVLIKRVRKGEIETAEEYIKRLTQRLDGMII
jgi:hypothetical protein